MNTRSDLQLEDQLSTLIANLGDDNGLVRQQARLMLMYIGRNSIPALLVALTSDNVQTRWEAVQILGELGDPECAVALTDKLMDNDTGVRWAAMESLCRLGRASLRPLLERFIKNFDSPWLREGVHHILHVLKDRQVLSERETILFESLDRQSFLNFGSGWTSEQAWAAEKALELIDQESHDRAKGL